MKVGIKTQGRLEEPNLYLAHTLNHRSDSSVSALALGIPPGVLISLGLGVRGYTKDGDNYITVTTP